MYIRDKIAGFLGHMNVQFHCQPHHVFPAPETTPKHVNVFIYLSAIQGCAEIAL